MIQEEDVNFDEFADTVIQSEQNNAQNNNSNSNSAFKFPVCCTLSGKKYALVRFVNGVFETATDQGKPGSGRAKLYNIAWVKDDNGKSFPLVLPPIINNKPMYESTMLDFIDKVLARTWIDNPDPTKKGSWKYFYEERNDYGQQQSGTWTLKDIFWNVYKSGHKEGEQYYESQKSWRGQTVYIANVIDRLDYKWHQENKKTKLLMKSITLKGENVNHKEVSFYAIGAPLKELCDNHGYDLKYDVLIIPGKASLDKLTLKNMSTLKEKDYYAEVKSVWDPADIDKISTLNDFTDEEKTWETIDIGKYYRFTSAATIIKHFGKMIQAFDDMVGTNFMEKFKDEAAADKAVREAEEARKKAEAEANGSTPEATPATTTTTASTPAPEEPEPETPKAEDPKPSFDTMEPANVSQPAPTNPAPQPTPVADTEDITSFYDDLD